jgi:hypothetical protein
MRFITAHCLKHCVYYWNSLDYYVLLQKQKGHFVGTLYVLILDHLLTLLLVTISEYLIGRACYNLHVIILLFYYFIIIYYLLFIIY